MDIAVIGSPEFTLGFRISGIQRVVDVQDTDNAESKVSELMADTNVGIMVTDEKTMERLSERMREDVESSVRPVAVVVSTESTAQDALRKMIIKSIGVDLWKD
ncbi:V-type ATP synthase subunit F [Candidatus Woesearchaeota archaeon]|nr:V-type ATP synthase subunit F [Candidatus Woesearchaeota archaeon]